MTPETNRIIFQVEAYVSPNKTDKEIVEWVQKFFDYHHPSLAAKVSYQGVFVNQGEHKEMKSSTKPRK